jgi:hypothetical protein
METDFWVRFNKSTKTAIDRDDSKIVGSNEMEPPLLRTASKSQNGRSICEAVTRPTVHFVPIKRVEQQDLQALPRTGSGSSRPVPRW